MKRVLLSVRGLSVDYGEREHRVPAVRDVSFDLSGGEIVGLVGESGSGKTTLALSLLGVLPAGARVVAGTAEWEGRDLLSRSDRERRALRGREIAMIFQDPLSALHPSFAVVDQVAEALRVHRPNLDRRTARTEAVVRLARVGIPEAERRARQFPHQWSGGMRQRALVAMAMAHGPRLLLADEPTTALDVAVQARIIELLRRTTPASTEHDAATLLITHDFGLIAELADRVLVMHEGRIIESGDVASIFDAPAHPHTAELLALRPGLGSHGSPGDGVGPVERVGGAPTARAEAPLLRVEHLRARYRSQSGRPGQRAVDDVSFEMVPGEVLGLVGESGSGKTSLARALVGLLPHEGTIRLAGDELTGRRTAAERRALQIVFQDPYSSLNPRRTVGGTLREVLRIHRLHTGAEPARVRELLDLVELGRRYEERYPSELSGGERQRIAIARALACEPRLVVLDEPVTSLDVAVQARILSLLERLRRRLGNAFLLIAHDLRLVRDVADRVAVMHGGRIVELGDTAHVFEHPEHGATRDLLRSIPAAHPRDRAAARKPARPEGGDPANSAG